MDFVTALPRSPKGNNAMWVIVDRLKSTHFIPFRLGQSTELLAKKYLHEVVRLHGVPVSIVPIEILDFYLTFGELFKRAWEHN